MHEFWLLIDELCPASLRLVNACRELADERSLLLCVLRITYDLDPQEISSLSAAGAEHIICLHADASNINLYRQICDCIAVLARDRKPSVIIFENRGSLSVIAPMLAIALDRGITADCTDLRWDCAQGLVQIRSAFGEMLIAENISLDLPVIASVRPNAMSGHFDHAPLCEAQVEKIDLEPGSFPFHLLHSEKDTAAQESLDRAKLIFSGGQGMGNSVNFSLLDELAFMTGGAVGASRAAVAAGFAPFSRQVGQTGTIVRPRIYFAFGISGAVQHLCGIAGSAVIVAVNLDPKAPIRRYCDYFIQCDCVSFAEQLRDELKKPL